MRLFLTHMTALISAFSDVCGSPLTDPTFYYVETTPAQKIAKFLQGVRSFEPKWADGRKF